MRKDNLLQLTHKIMFGENSSIIYSIKIYIKMRTMLNSSYLLFMFGYMKLQSAGYEIVFVFPTHIS